MSFDATQIDALKAPLGKSHVKTRAQAGRQLSYVEGWWAIAEANRIFGFGGWDRETVDIARLGEPREVDGKWRVAFMCKVRVTVRANGTTVVREGCGYGSGIDRDLGSAHESALKEAETDAMKRALMTFGNPFGLALYDKDQNGVADDTAPAERPRTASAKAEDQKTALAIQFGHEALEFYRNVKNGGEFDRWEERNYERVVRVQQYDKDLYAKIFAVRTTAISKLNPVSA